MNIKKYTLFFYITISLSGCENPTEIINQLRFEQSKGLQTATYPEVIDFYTFLSKNHNTVKLLEMGETDSGNPLHIVIYNPSKDFDFKTIRKNKAVLFINNGIHPGESDGIDATMMLFRDLASGKIASPENTVVVAIPVYNIGGALNRNTSSRANQDGPEAYGFRGNARNYDLNRDFIKCDSKNARAFAEIFHLIKPDVFVDNHVSNGADYQYTLTHLSTQHNKLGGELGEYLNQTFVPSIEKNLAKRNMDITPYVNVFNKPPDEGFSQFMDHPRYSTGYTALFNTLGLMLETHMLKPYKQRVEGTYEFMHSVIMTTDKEHTKIKKLRLHAAKNLKKGMQYPIQWDIDSTRFTTLEFKGYAYEYKKSNVTGHERLFYDREKPKTQNIPFYNHFKPTRSITVPKAYLIPKGWWNIIELLEKNRIEMAEIKADTIITAEVYKIKDYNTRTTPFEGHYMHYNTIVTSTTESIQAFAGDYIVSTDQKGIRYLLETLEPEAIDSFFNWNFFDSILQQKEGFSTYVFEETAEDLLRKTPSLKEAFKIKRSEDKEFRESGYLQLDWIYKNSPHYEKIHLRYPVFRILD